MQCFLCLCCSWPLTYGIGFIGVAGALSGIVFNAFIRQKFKLMNFGPIMTFAPSVAIPCFTSMITHQMFVTTPVLIREFNCPLCGEMRAMSLQVVTGFLQPCLVSVFACSVIARYKYTVPVPPATKPRELLQFIAKTLRPIRIQALGLLGLNIVVAMYITQEEGKAALKLQRDVRSGNNLLTD